jgi:hypothetical protein
MNRKKRHSVADRVNYVSDLTDLQYLKTLRLSYEGRESYIQPTVWRTWEEDLSLFQSATNLTNFATDILTENALLFISTPSIWSAENHVPIDNSPKSQREPGIVFSATKTKSWKSIGIGKVLPSMRETEFLKLIECYIELEELEFQPKEAPVSDLDRLTITTIPKMKHLHTLVLGKGGHHSNTFNMCGCCTGGFVPLEQPNENERRAMTDHDLQVEDFLKATDEFEAREQQAQFLFLAEEASIIRDCSIEAIFAANLDVYTGDAYTRGQANMKEHAEAIFRVSWQSWLGREGENDRGTSLEYIAIGYSVYRYR